MKFGFASLLTLTSAATVIAQPIVDEQGEVISKRASVKDSAFGYASLNGGTTGGAKGSTVYVSTLSALKSAASASGAKTIVVSGPISGSGTISVSSDKTIVGQNSKVVLTGVGFTVKGAKNVIIRNLTIKKVVAASGDAIAIQKSTNVWVDHCDVSSDQSHGKDYYDGLIDITHAADYVTVSNTFIHDHYKASLVGHSDKNKAEDSGHLRVTYANNFFYNINSRTPSIRFGTAHIYNNYYLSVTDGLNARLGAQTLVEKNYYKDTKKAAFAVDNDGYAVNSGNSLNGATFTAPSGSLKSVPYSYSAVSASNVVGAVYGTAGATLTF